MTRCYVTQYLSLCIQTSFSHILAVPYGFCSANIQLTRAPDVSTKDSHLHKMISYRLPQPWPGWPDDFAAVLLALPHVFRAWLALVSTVQQQHALLRTWHGHQQVSTAGATLANDGENSWTRERQLLLLELAQIKAVTDTPKVEFFSWITPKCIKKLVSKESLNHQK